MTQHSNESLIESLSALADGEATPLEMHRLLKASGEQAELDARWSRYHIAGAVIRRDLSAVAPAGFAAGISAALDEEAAPKAQNRHWWQHAGRVAVAASVAGAVLLGVQQYPQFTDGFSGEASVAGGAMETNSPAASGGETGEANAPAASQPVSLPAGYQASGFPTARTASAQSGYEPGQRSTREVFFVPVQAESVQVPAEEVRAYLNQLMEEHGTHAVRNSNQGVLPFARVSSDDDQ